MSNGDSLEEERQAILERMQMRRESYRRALTGGGDLDEIPLETAGQAALTHAQGSHGPAYSPLARPIPTRFPRSALMRVVTRHPLICALGVAVIVVIGPKRIMRSVATSGPVLTTLAGRNRSNIDLLGKVLTMAGAYVQRRTDRDRR